MARRTPNYFEIPAGTRQSECRSCRAPIYWVKTMGGKMQPISAQYQNCTPPKGREPGSGVSHFINCPHADQHRRKQP